MSTARLFLCKRLAAISAMVDEYEGKYITGKRIDVNEYLALVQVATRLSNTIGLNRKAKQVPSLDDYIARNYGTQQTYHADADDTDDADEDDDAPRSNKRVLRRTRHTIDAEEAE